MSLLRRLHLAAGAAYAVAAAVVVAGLPERVPLHFGPSGAADRYGSRGEAVLMIVLVGAGVAGLFAGCAWLVRHGSMQWMNVPSKDWWTATPAREQRLRRRLADDMDAFGAATLLLLAGLVLLVGRAADDGEGLGAAAWILLSLYVLFVGAWSAWALVGRYRPRAEGADGTPRP